MSDIRTEKLPDVLWHGLIGDWKTPMSDGQTRMMVNMIFADHDEGSKPMLQKIHDDMMKGLFQYQVLVKRFEVVGILDKFSIPTLAFVVSLCENVGDVVMWAYTLNYIRVVDKLDRVTIDDLVARFPWGFPTKDERNKLWDAQKGYALGLKCDNWVDQFQWPQREGETYFKPQAEPSKA